MSTAPSLPAGTTLGKSFEYGLDINLGLVGTPQWQPARRISAWAPTYPATTEDIGTYDSFGSPDEDVTGRGFATSFTIQGNRSLTTGLFLPEVEALLAAAKAKGEAAVLDVRWYHKPETGTPNPNDAGRSLVRVEVTRQNTGNTGNEVFAVTLTGKGSFERIPNPFAGWEATAPVVAFVGPVDAGTGDLITIQGSGLLGATAVTIGGIPADEFAVINAGAIVAVNPEDEAGVVPVVVTTPGGVSTAFSLQRGA